MDRFAPITSTAATLTLDKEVHGGTIVNQSLAATWTITVPAAVGDGTVFEVYVGTTLTANGIITCSANSGVLFGGVALMSDVGGVTCPTTATDNTITMNGGTTGGVKGSRIVLKDVASNQWHVSGALLCTSTEATPFSAV